MRRAWIALLCGCAAHAPLHPMQLRRVVLYQNGIGYFERTGHVRGDTIRLRLARNELDDVLKTLTVIDRLGAGVTTVDVPTPGDKDRTIELGVRLSAGRTHDVRLAYAVPTPAWRAAYRLVLDEHESLLQGWAIVNNASQEDWDGVQLTLATGAPMSFALDLHTPEYVERPDATGTLVAPTVSGVVSPEQAAASDHDGDGIPDSVDSCPNEPETYNGTEDADGCPDRARVVTNNTEVAIVENVYFRSGSDEIVKPALPVIDEIAAAIQGNPDITKVEVGGHASADEPDPWVLSARRADAVRDALVQHGIAAQRLVAVPYGATRPLDDTGTLTGREKNRRVDFVIAERAEPGAQSSTGRTSMPSYDPGTARRSVHTSTKPASVAGAVRYVLSEPVTIRHGGSTMISILNKSVSAEDVMLFRPDDHAPGSDRHPFRAVRFVNTSGYTLEPGPIAVFARGTFVGDSLIRRLEVGETAWIPYALEGGTVVTATDDQGEKPVRIVAIQHGIAEVEDADVRTTSYTIQAGREPAKKIYLRHAKHAGYAARDLPPGTLDEGDAYLVPLPVQPGKTSVLAIEERQPRRRSLEILDAGAPQLGAYVEGSALPPATADRLRAVLALRKDLGAIDVRRADLRDRLGELAARTDEVRRDLRAIDRVHGADALRAKLLASLAQLTKQADAIAVDLATTSTAFAAARTRLADALRDLTVGAADRRP